MEKYTIDIPPFEISEFDLMSPKEADCFFQWYISNISKRLFVLSEYIKATSKTDILLDGTDESLISIWKWLTGCMEASISLKKLKTSIKQLDFVNLFTNNKALSVNTYAISMDVALYFAESLIKHNKSLSWSYFTKPKNQMSVNKPIVKGFKNGIVLDPRLVVENLLFRSLKEKDDYLLLKTYLKWESLVR